MAYLGVPIAVMTMFLAQRLEARLGAAAAGWFAALPIAFAVAGVTMAVTVSRSEASLVALSAAGHAGPMIAYGISFVWATTRLGTLRGFALAVGVYVAASVAILPILEPLRIGIGVVAIVIGNAFMSRRPRATNTGQAATSQRILSLASAGLVVALITVANRYSGPDLAGALGAFPTMTTTIAVFLAYRCGIGNAGSVMSGMVKSLPIYLTFSLAFAFLIVRTTTPSATAGATGLALLAAMLTWREGTGLRVLTVSPLPVMAVRVRVVRRR
jgi:uncharacterized membrane protein (GlpM family)